MAKIGYWADNYLQKRRTGAEAVKMIRPGQRVFIGSASGEPQHLVRTLSEEAERLIDIEIANTAEIMIKFLLEFVVLIQPFPIVEKDAVHTTGESDRPASDASVNADEDRPRWSLGYYQARSNQFAWDGPPDPCLVPQPKQAAPVKSVDIEAFWEALNNTLCQYSWQSTAFTVNEDLKYRLLLITLIGALFGILVGLVISQYISRNFKKLQAASIKIARGEVGAQMDVESNDEIGQLIKNFKLKRSYPNNQFSSSFRFSLIIFPFLIFRR